MLLSYRLIGMVVIAGFTLALGCVGDRVKPYVHLGQERGMRLVRFNLHAPSAREVYLAGSFNDWTVPRYEDEDYGEELVRPYRMSRSQAHWTVVVPLSPGVHYYKYYVDRLYWRIDETSHEKTQTLSGEWRNIVVVQ